MARRYQEHQTKRIATIGPVRFWGAQVEADMQSDTATLAIWNTTFQSLVTNKFTGVRYQVGVRDMQTTPASPVYWVKGLLPLSKYCAANGLKPYLVLDGVQDMIAHDWSLQEIRDAYQASIDWLVTDFAARGGKGLPEILLYGEIDHVPGNPVQHWEDMLTAGRSVFDLEYRGCRVHAPPIICWPTGEFLTVIRGLGASSEVWLNKIDEWGLDLYIDFRFTAANAEVAPLIEDMLARAIGVMRRQPYGMGYPLNIHEYGFNTYYANGRDIGKLVSAVEKVLLARKQFNYIGFYSVNDGDGPANEQFGLLTYAGAVKTTFQQSYTENLKTKSLVTV